MKLLAWVFLPQNEFMAEYVELRTSFLTASKVRNLTEDISNVMNYLWTQIPSINKQKKIKIFTNFLSDEILRLR